MVSFRRIRAGTPGEAPSSWQVIEAGTLPEVSPFKLHRSPMIDKRYKNYCLYLGIIFLSFCSNDRNGVEKDVLFTVLESKRTGLDFRNDLKATPSFNMFKYMYFYNGAGVGAGDFNKDGLIDLFFASNQGENKIYINEGYLKFTDQTRSIQDSARWRLVDGRVYCGYQ